jgi:FkbM family methyltransferase
MKSIFRKIYISSGLRTLLWKLDISGFATIMINIFENISLLPKSLNKDEVLKERSIDFLKYSFQVDYEYKNNKNKSSLDDKSANIVDLIFKRYLFIAQHDFLPEFSINEKKEIITADKETEKSIKKYKLAAPHYESCVFYENCGLKDIGKEFSNMLLGKDVIDGGAFIGDSALMFLQTYSVGRVFAFEPEKHNYQLLLETKIINNDSSIIPINSGLSDVNENKSILCNGPASTVTDKGTEIIKVITIDTYIKEHQNINVSLIKLDIEGYELKAIKGAVETIKKFKPILLISIYHTPADFFEIKPYIENLNLGYKFIVKKINPSHPVYETMLICLPNLSL